MITIPTISELKTSIQADLESAYGDSIPIFGKNFLRALVNVQAAKLKVYYLAIAKLQKNIFIDTADKESSGGTLERFGRVKLGRNPFAALAGKYTVQVTGTTGATIPANTTFKSNNDSLNPDSLFILDVAKVLAGTTDTIVLRALLAGVDSKLLVGDVVVATGPIANVNSPATVTIETVQPLAAEDIEDYRAKGLEAYRTEPQGGAGADYKLWAKDAQGVEQVYPYAKSGAPGEINLYVEATLVDSTDGKGTPSAGILAAVQAVVEFDPDVTKTLYQRGRQPLTVLQVHYIAISVKEVNINISGFTGITADTQALILAELTAQISKIRPFVATSDILSNKNDILDINKIILAILTAKPGSIFGAVTMTVNAVSETSHTFTAGDIPHLNTVTYV